MNIFKNLFKNNDIDDEIQINFDQNKKMIEQAQEKEIVLKTKNFSLDFEKVSNQYTINEN